MSETKPKDDRIVVETWAFLGMLATEIERVSGDATATQELAQRVKGIAEAVREQDSPLPSSTEKEG